MSISVPVEDGRFGKSIYTRQLDDGFAWLKFCDGLEQEFRSRNRREGLKQLRIILSIGFLFGFTIAGFDYFLNGSGFSNPSVPLRAAINQPMILVLIAATFFETGRRYLTPLAILLGLVITSGSFFFTSVAELRGVGTSVTGQLVGTFYIYFFLGLRFWPATMTACLVMIGFFITAVAANAPGAAIFYNGMFLVFTNLIGGVGLYNLEYSRRLGFLKERELEHLVSRDALTGLANRKSFDEHLERAWAHCRREKLPLSAALIDIDHFKTYNDVYGHQRGDRCLVAVAGAIDKLGHRPLDLAARYGGEEFVVLLPGCSARDASAILDDLRSRIFELNLSHSESTTASVVTVSVGIAEVFPHATNRSAAGLIQSADTALYEAKSNGRNRVVIAKNEDIDAMKTGVFQLSGSLRKVANDG